MKQRITLLAACMLLCLAGFSQNYKSGIVGMWRAVKVDDNAMQSRMKQTLDTATTDATKLAVAIIVMGVELTKAEAENSLIMFEKKGAYREAGQTLSGDKYDNKGSYKFLQGDIVEITTNADGEVETKTYKVVELTKSKMVLEQQDFAIFITFEKK